MGSVAAPFSLTQGGGTATIPPRGSRVVKVMLTPTAAGSFTGTLVVTSNDPQRLTTQIALTGKAKAKR